MQDAFREILEESIRLKQAVAADPMLLADLHRAAALMTECLRNGGRVMLCGNGGSAADAQHIAAELSGRFAFDRAPLDAEALHANSSYLTAVANDYHFDEVYARLLRAKARPGDLLIALSTSGHSANVLKAAQEAQNIGVSVIGMTGRTGGQLKDHCTICLRVPSDNTARIQEVHITLGHILCGAVEQAIFTNPQP